VTAPAQVRAATPVWVQRLRLFFYVAFCIDLGLFLLLAPWRSMFGKLIWNSTAALVPAYPNLEFWGRRLNLRIIFLNHFFRGIVSGFGVIDLWLGISAALFYRDRR
jgi:hypothetical protein